MLALTRLGHDASQLGSDLAELAAGARAPPCGGALCDLLAPCDARRLLALLAAAEEAGPAAPEALASA